jgi:hypothetical protein
VSDEQPTFWQSAWAWIKRVGIAIAAPLPAILLVVGAVLLVALGAKNIQIGGLLAKLFGKEANGSKAIDVANSIPKGRVDKDGNLIPIGTPDSQGMTQAKVIPIQDPGLFDDPTHVKIVPPGQTKPVVVKLPDGVRAKDVDKVIIVKPEVYAVTVRDSNSVSGKDVDELLAKYGS